MTERGNVERVRRLWEAYEHGGVDEALEVVEPDVEWQLFGTGGRVLHGREDLRAYFESRRERGDEIDASPYTFEAHGQAVVVSGHVRFRTSQGMTDTQLHWLYTFRDGRLIRFEAFPNRELALAAAGPEK